jgi:hypothetical protein
MKKIFHAVFILAIFLWPRFGAAETLPLAGEWRFALDRHDGGTNENWFAKNLPDKIQLPGILEAQSYGDAISTHTPWVLSLYDHFWFLRADYAAYTNAGSVKVPFISQPPRHYLGAAWYQRDFEIPTNWNGKRVTLFLERPHWQSTIWLDGKKIGSDISLCAPHEFDFGILRAGKHRLTIRVDNRMILPYRPDAHSVSDSLDDAWNGIVGKIELRATPPVWIDDVQIFPNVERKKIRARMMFHNLSGEKVGGKISFFIEPFPETTPLNILPASENFDTTATNNELEETFNLGDNIKTWDEFSPALYKLRINTRCEIGGKIFEDNTEAVFGLRDFYAEGNQFILNGHPIYFRGTHFGGDFPLTGYPPTDVASWKKIFQTCKNYGLNHMRFHSWCPPEAAFEAADELGFYLQIECGMWNEFSPKNAAMTRQLYSETERILKNFGNHPSLMLISASNEAGGNWKPVLSAWVKHFRAEDPRHLYTPDTGWSLIESPDEPLNGGADYLVVGHVGRSHNYMVRGASAWFGGDFGDSLRGLNAPVIAHELGQWCAYPDFDVIKKFGERKTFMQPGNYEIFRDSANAHGVLAMDKKFARASGKFQLACYKEEIEANLRTPGLSGFQLLDLHDYTGQGTALVGLLDPFWESKDYAPPDEFKKFCNDVVPLAWLPKRIFTTDEKLAADIGIANFSDKPLTNGHVMWFIHDKNGKRFGGGYILGPALNSPVGFKDKLYRFTTSLSNLPAPAEYKLVAAKTFSPATATNESFENDWNFWLYPAHISDAVPTNVFVTSSWDDAQKNLAADGRVLFLPRNADLNWSSPPLARTPIFWNAQMGPTWGRMLGLFVETNSPALAEFPTDENCDWQWTELLRNTRAINLDNLPRNLSPMVWAIDDWNRNYKLGLIFEARVGAGKLLVCAADLNTIQSPVAKQLRRSLLDYMAGEKFNPPTEISAADFAGLHFDTRIMRELGARAKFDGRRADEIIDGDPNTFYLSGGGRNDEINYPHEIQISFPQSVAMNGLILMPRQNHREHQGDIRDYKIEASDDGANWNEIARGRLASTFAEQKIIFSKITRAKCLKFIALSGFGGDRSAALAELAVIYAGKKLSDHPSGNVEYRNIRTASPDIDAGTTN